MSGIKGSIRSFSTLSRSFKPGYSTVEPVHHLVNVRKAALKPGYKDLLIPKDDIRAVGFKPTEISQDRVAEYYNNVLESDLMLHFYEHDAKVIPGQKKRDWGVDSPYALFRGSRKPRGITRPTRDIKPVKWTNVPELTGITLNAYSSDSLEESWLNISVRLLIAQITNVKPKQLYNRSNVLPWKVRQGKPCGCKVELTGRDMTQFLSTLTELVLPRIRTFRGIKETSGDGYGNISFGLTSEDVKYFPEVENFQELYPNLFGFHITFKTTAKTDERARVLLSSFGLPFYKPENN